MLVCGQMDGLMILKELFDVFYAFSELNEDLSGSGACFMANGLAVLSTEEYLTITTTTASPPSGSISSSGTLLPPAHLQLPQLPSRSASPSRSPHKNSHSPNRSAQLTSACSLSTEKCWDDEEEDDEDPRKVYACIHI